MAVKAGNDANVAALGEMWQGGGKGHSNVVAVTLVPELVEVSLLREKF